MSFKLTLKERKSPHFMEDKPRYDVQVNGVTVCELYYNMHGYRGYLMGINGLKYDMGERGISAYKREAAALNRDAKLALARHEKDGRKVVAAHLTRESHILRLDIDDGSHKFVLQSEYRAMAELLGPENLGPTLFNEQGEEDILRPGIILERDEDWSNSEFVLAVLPTTDPEQVAIVTGIVPECARLEILNLMTSGEAATTKDMRKKFDLNWVAHADHMAFMRRETLEQTSLANGQDLMNRRLLPGVGYFSENVKVFMPQLSSRNERPAVVLDSDEDRLFGPLIEKIGYQVELVQTNEPVVHDDEGVSPGM